MAVITAAAGTVLASSGIAHANMARPAGATQQASEPDLPIVRIDKMFDSCAAVKAYYAKGVPPAFTKLEYTSKFTQPESWDTGGDFWEAKAYAKTTVDVANSRIIMDVVAWKHMTKADKAVAKELDAAMLGHEEGHVKWEGEILHHYQHYLLKGAGDSSQAAIDDLYIEEVKYAPEIDRIMKFEGTVYDAKTENGLKQHVMGGKDTTLICPRR